jgi:hypothetical protein
MIWNNFATTKDKAKAFAGTVLQYWKMILSKGCSF